MNPGNNKPSADHDLGGAVSLNFKEGKSFGLFCSDIIPEYNITRFEAFAVRLFFGNELTITVYALDKLKQEGNNYNHEKIPVKKFKLQGISFEQLRAYIDEFNFTLTTGNYEIEDMEVINK